MDYESLMTRYMQARRKVDLIEGEAATAAAQSKEIMKMCLQVMEAKALDDGLKNVPVKGIGTGYFTTILSATVANPSEFKQFVKENDAWDLIENRASSTAVKSYIEGNNAPVPGVSFSQTQVFKIRSASSTRKE
jgi:hypothetical protein